MTRDIYSCSSVFIFRLAISDLLKMTPVYVWDQGEDLILVLSTLSADILLKIHLNNAGVRKQRTLMNFTAFFMS